jgi:GT2 family glycosyltransferase
MTKSPLIGILVTYRRQHILSDTLDRILTQTRSLDELWVVDNEASVSTQQLVEDAAAGNDRTLVHYTAARENLGSAGGWALGMRLALAAASDGAWIIPLDDDNPPSSCRHIESVAEFAAKARERHANLAAAGIVGGRFNWRSGLISRVPDDDLHGEIPVDFLGCGYQPMYHVAALRDVGVFDEKLFFGYTEVEYGLRLRRAGYTIVADGDAWHRLRLNQGRLGISVRPSPRCLVTWKKYYSIRNYVYVMKNAGYWYFVAKQVLIQCLLKPLFTSLRDPRTAIAGLRLAWRATIDGLTGRMGRRVEPIMTVRQASLAPNIGLTRNVSSAAHSTPK